MLEFDWDVFPNLETERFDLRRLNDQDVDAMFLLRSEKESMEYIGRPRAKNLQDVKELMERVDQLYKNQDGINWAICKKGNPELMGTIGFYRMKKEHYRAEVGYQLRKEFFRMGVMYEVLQVVVNYGFEKMKLHTIEADINPENIASQKLLEKSKFVKEAHFLENFYFEGKFYDAGVYSKISPFPHTES